MNKYQVVADDAMVSLESSRSWFLQGLYWLLTAAIVLFDGSFVGSDPPLRLTVRDRRSGKLLHCEGPYFGAEAVAAADEAARVIRVLGVQGYIRREES